MGQTSLAESAQHFSRMSYNNAVAAAAWISRGSETAVLEQLDRRSAAEKEIPPPPAHELVAPVLEPVELGRVGAALAVKVRFLEMHARLSDRLAHIHAVDGGVEDDLQDRSAQTHRAGTTDDQARPAVCRQYPDSPRCGYYEFLKFERAHQDDPDFIALT